MSLNINALVHKGTLFCFQKKGRYFRTLKLNLRVQIIILINMKKIKYPIKKKRTGRVDQGKFAFNNPYKPGKVVKILFYVLIILLPVFLTFLYLRTAFKVNQVFSFPLDDPWIHLTFAKNLAEYFSFSYFKNEMVTAGSTSPLYTILLAIGFFITSNEMILSYVLGILFFLLAAVAFYWLASVEFVKENVFAMICTGIFVIDKWMNFISVSGMETTMFIFILILCAYFYRQRRTVPFAVMLGLIMWTRPDGAVFIIALIIDYMLVRIYSKDEIYLRLFSNSELKKIVLIFSGILGLYFIMNLILSGSVLPNTYNAKLTYYSPEFRSRYDFLRNEVWRYFTKDSKLSFEYFIINLTMLGFLFSVGKLIFDIFNKTYNQNTLYILFILGLVFIYWLKLPYAHRFGRYMMPIIPFFILVATIGFRDLARLINRFTENLLFAKSIFYIFIGITFFLGVKDYDDNREEYAIQCKYIYDRQVKAALWIKENTKENDVIATHDVGAIGFYSNRKIVDVAGLVTPELIKKINDIDYVRYMTDYMSRNGVTYLAFLREWYRVANQDALFTTAGILPPETMEVFKFEPGKTKILSREVNSLLMKAQMLMGRKDGQQMIYVLNRLLALDPECAQAYFLRGFANMYLNDNNGFERDLLKAVEIYPNFSDAHYYLGEFYKNEGRFTESQAQLTKFLELIPGNKMATEFLRIVNDSLQARQNTDAASFNRFR